jgi:hypothetical protein
VARYIGRHGESRVGKVALISAVTPSVLQTEANPAGVLQAAFEALQAQLAANRSEFFRFFGIWRGLRPHRTTIEPSTRQFGLPA